MGFYYTLLLIIGCKSAYLTEPFSTAIIPPKPNYELEQSWAILPTKYPTELNFFSNILSDTLQADVFYVYPTLITDKKDKRWNISIYDKEQNERVLNKAVKLQASAWFTSGKLYVPYYRQAHLKSYSNLNKGGKEALQLAYEDVKEAFEVYLNKYNNGRPIIIASHSQGTTHTKRLLKEFFDGKPLQKKLIAAYLIGIGVKSNEFQSITHMKSPNETGGFVSWNTFKKGHYPKKNKTWYAGSVATNPITWDESKSTTYNEHKGFLFSNEKLYSNALKIEINDGLVWSTNPKFPFRFFMSFKKNYHVGDVNLFWQDIRENAELRTNKYLQPHH
ncbi:MAG: DUF3089 domain-containing protein [Flavobacteriaceae bacterium]|nr:DUF3089 domain-containing protein [Flavobacteriaceae bacterium]